MELKGRHCMKIKFTGTQKEHYKNNCNCCMEKHCGTEDILLADTTCDLQQHLRVRRWAEQDQPPLQVGGTPTKPGTELEVTFQTSAVWMDHTTDANGLKTPWRGWEQLKRETAARMEGPWGGPAGQQTVVPALAPKLTDPPPQQEPTLLRQTGLDLHLINRSTVCCPVQSAQRSSLFWSLHPLDGQGALNQKQPYAFNTKALCCADLVLGVWQPAQTVREEEEQF